MKPRWLFAAAFLGLGGCGGQLEATSDASPAEDASRSDTTTDRDTTATGASDGTALPTDVLAADAFDATDPPSAPVGCPPTEPTPGQACGGGPYYCYYYLADTCPEGVKCTSGGGPPFAFDKGFPNCKLPPVDACNEGKECGSFERNGGCVVPCSRWCHCGPTGTLVCESIEC